MCECADVQMCEFINTNCFIEFAHLHICTFAHQHFVAFSILAG